MPEFLSPSKAAVKRARANAREKAKKQLLLAASVPGDGLEPDPACAYDSDLGVFVEEVVPADGLAGEGGLEERVVGLEAFMHKSHSDLSSTLRLLLEQMSAQNTLTTEVAPATAERRAAAATAAATEAKLAGLAAGRRAAEERAAVAASGDDERFPFPKAGVPRGLVEPGALSQADAARMAGFMKRTQQVPSLLGGGLSSHSSWGGGGGGLVGEMRSLALCRWRASSRQRRFTSDVLWSKTWRSWTSSRAAQPPTRILFARGELRDG